MKAEASPEQRDYLVILQKRLAFPDGLLDQWCVQNMGMKVRDMDRGEVSRLIEKLKEWKQLPPDLMRAKGQMDLF